ncbi:MAG: hypothetical protein KJ811_05735 [Candidatus Margulisbacteria bacterium]|nr:hypothetical protein [Candidatus Margulisiibacteriota bacterium]
MVGIARTFAIASLALASILPGCGQRQRLVRPSPSRISCSDPVQTGSPQHFSSVRAALAHVLDQHPEMQTLFLGGPERARANPYPSALEVAAEQILPEAIARGISRWLTNFSANDPGLEFAADCHGRVGFMAGLREPAGTLTRAGADFSQSIQSFIRRQGEARSGVYVGGSYQEFCAETQVENPAVKIYIMEASLFLSGERVFEEMGLFLARNNYPSEGANILRIEGTSTYLLFLSNQELSDTDFPGCMY